MPITVEPKVTSLHLFCQTNSPKHKDFSVRNDKEKQQIFTFNKLNKTLFDISAWKVTETIIKVVVN